MEVNQGEDITLTGYGYGHGVGMSQNAANEMAKEGYNYEEILNYFYRNIEIGTR
jgi:stage II sporulation protein D